MKILFITHYYAPDSGAAPNRLTRLAEMLQKRGHEVTVLTTLPHYPDGIVPEEYRRRWQVVENRNGVRVMQVWLWTTPSKKIILRLISQLSFMLTAMLRGFFLQKPDVILIENQPIFTGLAGWFISKIKRSSYVLNVSDHWPEYLIIAGVVKESSLIYKIFKRLTNLTQHHAGAITVMYDNLLDKIEARIGKVKNAHTIYNAVDLSLYQKSSSGIAFREKHNLGNKRIITFSGILGPHIDLALMLDVVQKLGKHPDVTVLFVSGGSQQAELEQALEKPEFAHCRILDWLKAEEMPAFWDASYLSFWALHDNELDKLRFQAKLYEAVASGTPVVIAVEGLMSEFLEETQTGFTVKHGDSESMLEAINRLLNDSELYTRMSENGRNYAIEHFDAEKQTSAYENVLQDIANSP